MRTVGVVCEYNPFHLGHARQLALLRQQDPEAAVVCLMSGLYVQRGQPAVFSRQVRARAALLAGADLVLELPVTVSLRSAEGFAAGGVEILDRLGVEGISFGAETADRETLLETARQLLSPQFGEALRPHLDEGLSFPAARSRALKDLGGDPAVLGQRPHPLTHLPPWGLPRPGRGPGKPLRHGPPAADFGGGAVAGLRAGGGPPGL